MKSLLNVNFGNSSVIGLSDWGSFITIAAALIFIGFVIRTIVILIGAAVGEQDFISSIVKLIGATIALAIVYAFF